MVDSEAPYSSIWCVCAGLYFIEHLTKNNLADIYEVAVIIGSCFIVNYVTADSKTNWAEGVSMIAFYLMIVSRLNSYFLHFSYRNFYEALCAWFYPGQPELQYLSQCESVAQALTQPPASLAN
jgi:Ca2+:H+ antiporter